MQTSRTKTYSDISSELACLSDQKLMSLLDKAKAMYAGIGGRSVLLNIAENQVFVKKVPVTDLELMPEHRLSTANMFDLPLYYQYGVGSVGFGVWRELVTHMMTTNWVISGECPNFPILYHWRILPTSDTYMDMSCRGGIDSYTEYWDNSIAVRKRIEAIHNAKVHLVLFLEYLPQHLHEWLKQSLAQGPEIGEAAVTFIDEQLKSANSFMNSHGLLHFDAHFENILTDGKLLYLSDFGLALSNKFELSTAEVDFFNRHQNYDQTSTMTNLLFSIIDSFFGRREWRLTLEEYLAGNRSKAPTNIDAIIKKYAPIAFTMDTFYTSLQKKSKSTPYPAEELANLLKAGE
jgi:hypothetical protein